MKKLSEEVLKIFEDNGLKLSRLISFSKSAYITKNPDGKAVFNANVVTEADGKIWWGDLDVIKDAQALAKVAATLGKTIYVLYESDYRFETENRPFDEVLKLAVASFPPQASPKVKAQHPAQKFIKCLHFLASKARQFSSKEKKI